MELVFSVFAVIGFAFAAVEVLLRLTSWLREPSFRVLDATFDKVATNGEPAVLGPGRIIVLARGGARVRKIIHWVLYVGKVDEPASLWGSAPRVSPESIVIPPRDVEKVVLELSSSGRVVDDARELEMVFGLHLGSTWERVTFVVKDNGSGMYRSPLASEALMEDFGAVFSWHWLPWWKRALRRGRRIISSRFH